MAYGPETYTLMKRRRQLVRELRRLARFVEEQTRLRPSPELGRWLADRMEQLERKILDTYTRRPPRKIPTTRVVAARSLGELVHLALHGSDARPPGSQSEPVSVSPGQGSAGASDPR